MRFKWLFFVVAAGLLPSRTFQNPPRPPGTEKGFRLFGKNVVPHEPVGAGSAGDSPSPGPVNEFACDPSTWQGYPIGSSWSEHGSSGIHLPPCHPYPSSLRNSHYEQGSGSSLRPPSPSPPWPRPNVLSSPFSGQQHSPNRAPGNPTFMLDARRAVRQQPQIRQNMKTKHHEAKSQAATRAWKERKSEDEAKYATLGIRATSNNLLLLEADVDRWKKERKIDKEAARAFAQASRGRYGTMRLGMKENTDQGQIHVPLPSPEWIVTWRSNFNRAMKRQLETITEERGEGLKDFDPSYSEASHKVLEKAQTGLIRWLTTTPAYKGNNRNAKLRLLFEVNGQAKKDLPPSYREQIMLESEGADQPDTPRAPDIRYVISDRFIPPDDTGAPVYRSFSDDNQQEEDEGTAS